MVLAIMWVVHIFKVFTGLSLAKFGVYPRHQDGLIGIIASPLIHGDWGHIISNSVPFAVLSSMIFLFYRKVSLKAFTAIYFLSGILLWSFGRSVFHIGASGVVYGLLTFVFWTGIFRRNIKSIVLALIVTLLYSGYFYGIVPTQPGISWDGHLFGAIAGIIVAYIFKNQIENDEDQEDPFKDEKENYYLPRDTFEAPLKQREREIRPNDDWTTNF